MRWIETIFIDVARMLEGVTAGDQRDHFAIRRSWLAGCAQDYGPHDRPIRDDVLGLRQRVDS